MRQATFIYSSELEKHPYPADHPFNTVRAQRTRKIVDSMGLLAGDRRTEVAPRPAERIVLKNFHTGRYLRALRDAAKGRLDAEAFGILETEN